MASLTPAADGRLLVFVWSRARDAGGLFYQADIVPTPERRFLEIHSNCGDMNRLLKEVEPPKGGKFTPMETHFLSVSVARPRPIRKLRSKKEAEVVCTTTLCQEMNEAASSYPLRLCEVEAGGHQ